MSCLHRVQTFGAVGEHGADPLVRHGVRDGPQRPAGRCALETSTSSRTPAQAIHVKMVLGKLKGLNEAQGTLGRLNSYMKTRVANEARR